jgi:hypothetical protein
MKQYIGGKYRTVYHDRLGYYVIERDPNTRHNQRVPVLQKFKGQHGWRYDWDRFLK